MSDSIVKSIEIAAPVARVWDALIDHEKFGAWFLVALDQPFVVGQISTGRMTYPGYEHFPWESRTVAIEPMTRFAFEWPATGGDEEAIRTGVPEWMLVEFRLEPTAGGTKLTVTESGFDKVPEPRRSNILRDNDGGWAEQVENIKRYVEG
ncbi:MAG TPA: vanillate O-demethylase oxidoreductase VanB [Sphingobium sp.]|uniref:SRPBCC family protein n=1 Tax=unclassified Sphingobium TaxID=2611147 RepID=UPI000EC53FE2|nr:MULTISPECIES: SRPBCC family protein [unclassified Sphingobium]WIW89079.1 SRPBCC family protein [Sphingobium sp. V4]HAF40954.1 vanillate O-demethylase oxidoreductase VanB [Sphingobium sp.]